MNTLFDDATTESERPPDDEFAEWRAFRRALRNVIVPAHLRLTDDEAREYSFAVACLDCGIQPPMEKEAEMKEILTGGAL